MDIEEQTLKLLELKDGACPFDDWFASIRDEKTRAIVRARLGRLRAGNFGDCGSSGQNVQHIKIDYGPGYRIYFAQIERVIVVLLCGGDKSSQNRDVKKAHKLWEENKENVERFQRDLRL